MRRARILTDIDCGAWGVLPAGAVRDVVELGEEDVTVRFYDKARQERIAGKLWVERYLPKNAILHPMPINGTETVVVALSGVELTDELT